MSDSNDDDNVFRNGYISRSLKTDCNVAERKFDLVCNYKIACSIIDIKKIY